MNWLVSISGTRRWRDGDQEFKTRVQESLPTPKKVVNFSKEASLEIVPRKAILRLEGQSQSKM